MYFNPQFIVIAEHFRSRRRVAQAADDAVVRSADLAAIVSGAIFKRKSSRNAVLKVPSRAVPEYSDWAPQRARRLKATVG
jgi:hypothetical protein